MGIPHILANDLGSMGYGYGYAFAEDNLCTFLEDVITVRGQRSRYFGPEGSYNIPSVPVTASNPNSDFFWKLMATPSTVARVKAGATPDLQSLTTGFTAGINRYIVELQSGLHPGRHAACASAEYLKPISENDIYGRYYRLAIIASTSVFINEIATAQPPALSLSAVTSALPIDSSALTQALAASPGPLAAFRSDKPLGSNAYGLGPQATADGSSMLLGNPHFPWSGSERFYLAHLTVPGVLDVEGASLFGVPVLEIGFNDRLAWSHTVSQAFRFSVYQLPVNPLNPTQYFYDGKPVDMTAVPLSIDVKTSAGITTMQRTLYRTQYGPVVTLTSNGLPVLAWDNLRVYTIRDANEVNTRLVDQFLEFNRAPTLDAFKRAQRTILGVPWVNTIAAAPGAPAYYADISVVPNVPDSLVAKCSAPIIATIIGTAAPGLPVLQGQRPDCQWGNSPGAPPGIFGPADLPVLERQDFVNNENDSYWLSNPAQPLTGFNRIIGSENTERTLRTRLGILQIQRRMAGTDGRPGRGFTLDQLKDVALASDVYSKELALDSVLGTTCTTIGLTSVAPACAALATWDGKAGLDSKALPLWREFWTRASGATLLWTTPFSAADPVNTPRGLFASNPQVRKALVDAQQAVQTAGVALDARLGDVQVSGVHTGAPIPIFGAPGNIGAFTVASDDGLAAGGYKTNYGNSYIQAVTWNSSGLRAEGFLTYSQSTDPANPHYRDFSLRYSNKQWLRFAFTPAEIQASQTSQTVITGN